MAPNLTEQGKVIPPVFNEEDHEINLIDLDPDLNSRKPNAIEEKLLSEKK
jgi:hypothetical protein